MLQPLDDLQYLLDNAICFQKNSEDSQKKGKKKKRVCIYCVLIQFFYFVKIKLNLKCKNIV